MRKYIFVLSAISHMVFGMDTNYCPDIKQQYRNHKSALEELSLSTEVFFENNTRRAVELFSANLPQCSLAAEYLKTDIDFYCFGTCIEDHNEYLDHVANKTIAPGYGFMTGLHVIMLHQKSCAAEFVDRHKELDEEPQASLKRKRDVNNDGNGKKQAKRRRKEIVKYIKHAQAEEQSIHFKDLLTRFDIASSTLSRELIALVDSQQISEEENNNIIRGTIKRTSRKVEEAVRNKMSREALISHFKFTNAHEMFSYFSDNCGLSADEIFYLREKSGIVGKPGETRALIGQFLKDTCAQRKGKCYAQKKLLCQAFNDNKLLPRSITSQTFTNHARKLIEENALPDEVIEFYHGCDRALTNK